MNFPEVAFEPRVKVSAEQRLYLSFLIVKINTPLRLCLNLYALNNF